MSRLLLDCDGVVADFVTPMLEASGSELTPDDVDRWNVFELLSDAEETAAFVALSRSEFWRWQPLIPGAIEGVEALRRAGHEIFWVTSPWKLCSGWAHARRAWLEEHFGVDQDHVVVTASKHLVVGDLFVDDSIDNVLAWNRAHGAERALLFDAPYNTNLDYTNRTRWPDLGELRPWTPEESRL